MKLTDLKDLRVIKKSLEPQPEPKPQQNHVKLTDLKDLRVIKKSLEPQPEPKPQQNQPRKRSVELKSKEEEHARNEGLFKGQKVRMMDTNDTATLIGFGKDFYELELDGLTIRAVRSEDPLSDLTVDLHIERIPGSDGIPEWAALEFQMNYFRQVLRQNLRHKGKRSWTRSLLSAVPTLSAPWAPPMSLSDERDSYHILRGHQPGDLPPVRCG